MISAITVIGLSLVDVDQELTFAGQVLLALLISAVFGSHTPSRITYRHEELYL